MKKNILLEERRRMISKEISDFVDKSFGIVDRIHEILRLKNLEQKDLASLLGKSESEISKWMTGAHNFTIKTISKIEKVLDAPILKVVKKEKEKRSIQYFYLIDRSTILPNIGDKSRTFCPTITDIGINSGYKKTSSNLS